MTEIWAQAALWLGLALIATLLSIWLRIASALSEIVVGTVAQLIIAAAGVGLRRRMHRAPYSKAAARARRETSRVHARRNKMSGLIETYHYRSVSPDDDFINRTRRLCDVPVRRQRLTHGMKQ